MSEKPENLDPFGISQKQLYKAFKLMGYGQHIYKDLSVNEKIIEIYLSI